jgi:hypothetical protein
LPSCDTARCTLYHVGARRRPAATLPAVAASRDGEKKALLADDLLLRCDRAAPRALAGACVRVRPLAAHRQIPAVPDSAIRLDFDEPSDVHLDLLAEITFHAALLLDRLAQMIDFVFGQIADLFRVIDAGLRRQLLRALLPYAVNRSQPDPQALLYRKINARYTCHAILLTRVLTPGAACALG